MFIKTILLMLAFICVLMMSYYSCKWIASLQKGIQQSKHMKVRDKLLLSKDKTIQIVQIGSQYLLIGTTNDGISLLKELDRREMEEEIFDSHHNDSKTMDTILKAAYKKAAGLNLLKCRPRQRFADILKEKMVSHTTEEKNV